MSLCLLLPVLADVSATHNGGSGTIYAGSVLTLTCEISLPSSVQSIIHNLTVTSSWDRGTNGTVVGEDSRITVQSTHTPGSLSFLTTVEFDTLHTSDSDVYTCSATVTPSASLSLLAEGQASDTTSISVVGGYTLCS